MSFHWNLSSDEEEEEDDLLKELPLSLSTAATTGFQHPESFASVASARQDELERHQPNDFSFGDHEKLTIGDDDDDDVDEVDWEDADDELLSHAADLKPAANNIVVPLQPVTIDLDATAGEDDKEDSKKRKRPATVRRKRYRFRSLPTEMQSFLLNLHRTHLLAITSHALFLSKLSSDRELLHVAHSLIPFSWLTTTRRRSSKSSSLIDEHPTPEDLKGFSTWFGNLVNHTEERRRRQRRANVAAGAPRRGTYVGVNCVRRNHKPMKGPLRNPDSICVLYTPHRLIQFCNYLSSVYDEDPQLYDEEDESTTVWSTVDKALLFVSMCRSMGWRTRFVTVADPTKCDLDEDHPILNHGFFNFFRSSFGKKSHDGGDDAKANSADKQKPAKRVKIANKAVNVDEGDVNPDMPTLSWVEVLCGATQIGKSNGDKPKLRWIHVDPGRQLVDQPDQVEWIFGKLGEGRPVKKKGIIPYAMGAEHRTVDIDEDLLLGQLVDVTPRYSSSWTESLRARGVPIIVKGAAKIGQVPSDAWWTRTVSTMNQSFRNHAKQAYQELMKCRPDAEATALDKSITTFKPKRSRRMASSKKCIDNGVDNMNDHDEAENFEKEELQTSVRQEHLPTSKAAFKSHPVYALASLLNSTQVLAPDAKSRICGVFKGELVYRRSDVSTALPAKKWMYNGRKVMDSELARPVRTVKPRRKPTPKGFQALKSYGVGVSNDGSEQSRARDVAVASKPLEEDSMEALYAMWQTAPWSPDPVGPDDAIPTNKFNNIELELINPGLVHVNEPHVAKVAKKLGIPYAPCLLGFEGQGGNRVPVIRGIVVHEHNEQLLREAQHEVSTYTVEQEEKKRRDAIYSRWKRLIVGVLTKQRLEQAYKDDDVDD